MIVTKMGLGDWLDDQAASALKDSSVMPSTSTPAGGVSVPSSGSGFDPGKLVSAGLKLIPSGSSGGTTAPSTSGAKASTTAADNNSVLAAGASWANVKIAVFAPTCADEYDALLNQYNTRMKSAATLAMKQKLSTRTPLTQADLVIISWLRTAGLKLLDFRSKYGGVKTGWPTVCTGVKVGTVLPTGTATTLIGLGLVAAAGIVIWKLL
jgi:hypothetical protein